MSKRDESAFREGLLQRMHTLVGAVPRTAILVFGLALVLATSCATSSKPDIDPLTAQLAANGRAAYDRGAYPQALRFYEQALQQARARDDGPEIARIGYNLAACQLTLGRPADARASLHEALAEFGRSRMDSQPALLLDAMAAKAAGQTNDARRVLDLARTACKSDAQRQQVCLIRGEWDADTGNAADAAMALREASALASKDEKPSLKAARLNLSGRVASLQGNFEPAAHAFDAAATTWQTAGQPRDMADALSRAGDAFMLAGDARSATDRFYRAARSLYAQGNAVGALQCVQRGLEANTQASDSELQVLLTGLFDTIKQTVEKAKQGGTESAAGDVPSVMADRTAPAGADSVPPL